MAVAASGCDGSSKKSSHTTTTPRSGTITVTKSAPTALPKPKESLQAFERRLTSVQRDAETGKCAPVKAFVKSANLVLPCTPGKHDKRFVGFRVTGGATYGTAALIEYTDHEVASKKGVRGVPGASVKQGGKTGVYPLALGQGSSYVYMSAGASPIFPGSFIGTKPNGWASADAAATTFLKAVRDTNCSSWFKNTLTPKGMSKQQACQLGLNKAYGPLTQALKSGQPVTLARLGGNDVFYFYWLKIGHTGATLGVARDQPPAPAFITLGTTGGPAK